MGLSAGTAGSGKPVGNFQAKSSTPAHAKDASAASATKAAVHRMTYRIKRRPGSLPGRSRAFAREPHRLASDLAALVHPGAERFEHGAVDARRMGASRLAASLRLLAYKARYDSLASLSRLSPRYACPRYSIASA